MELRSLGRYTLVSSVPARSSAAKFFVARHEDDPQEAAPSYLVKVRNPTRGAEDDHARAQFEHEAKLLQAFNHPCIPTLHATGEQNGVAYIVMDLVEGIDLARMLGHDEGQPRALPKTVALFIMGQLADALRHVHELEIISDDGEALTLDVLHRDICPANVLLSREGDVMLTDFGSATSRWLAPQHEMSGAGHRAYLAPERVSGSSRATMQSDLFALAAMLWEMLRGDRLFAADDDVQTMDAIARFEVNHPSRRISGLSAKLSEIVRRNLDRDPGRRYSNAYQMLQRLAQAPEAQDAEQARTKLAAMVREFAGPTRERHLFLVQ